MIDLALQPLLTNPTNWLQLYCDRQRCKRIETLVSLNIINLCLCNYDSLIEHFAVTSAVTGFETRIIPVTYPNGFATLVVPNKGETAVCGCHCPRDMAVRMREVLARP